MWNWKWFRSTGEFVDDRIHEIGCEESYRKQTRPKTETYEFIIYKN